VSSSARLTVARNLPIDVQQRQIYITLDGQPWATMLYGQTVTKEIPPGAHKIRANNTLVWKTLSFDAQAGQHVEFDLANRAGKFLLSSLALLGVGPVFLTFEQKR
jgi:hypothetical protein